MHFDSEGHVVVTPREFQEALSRPAHVIHNIWLPGTPWAFPTYDRYCAFMDFLADRLAVHPRNLVVRGSSNVGFSVSARAEKAWMAMRPDSDLDLAIVDPDYYHFFDREIRSYERNPENLLRGEAARQAIGRRKSRRFYCYRYFDLPEIACVAAHNTHLKEAPVEQCCGSVRTLEAFIFRDWWSVYSRCEYDLKDLRKALATPGFPAGGETPRSWPLMLEAAEQVRATDSAAVTARRCHLCGGDQQLAPDGEHYYCPRCDSAAAATPLTGP